MPRRASLPGADLLFGGAVEKKVRPAELSAPAPAAQPVVEPAEVKAPEPAPAARSETAAEPITAVAPAVSREEPARSPAPKKQSIRPRHDEKITFYCTDADLTRLEAARLALRAKHKLSSDRGRIVRAALAEILDDFDARGAESALVKRLSAE